MIYCRLLTGYVCMYREALTRMAHEGSNQNGSSPSRPQLLLPRPKSAPGVGDSGENAISISTPLGQFVARQRRFNTFPQF